MILVVGKVASLMSNHDMMSGMHKNFRFNSNLVRGNKESDGDVMTFMKVANGGSVNAATSIDNGGGV